MACISTALMVGGGIAGLSVALALGRVGVKCDVVELVSVHLGASLGISGRAAETLEEMGVYDEVYATGTPWEPGSTAASMSDAAGRLISPGPQRPQWPGAKTAIGVYRPVFLQILEDAAQRSGATIRKGVTVETIDEGADTTLVTFTDGEKRRYDLVVGADGIGSRTRAMLFPDVPKPSYSGQMSIRWMAPGPKVEPEGWYQGPVGRLGFYYLPQGMVYVPAVIDAPTWTRPSKEKVYSLFKDLLDSYTAPAIVELRERLNPDSDLICRPFDWIFLGDTWHRGRSLLIGDAAHATTAHMGMGGGMALEDAVVLAQCVSSAPNLAGAFDTFMARRLPRARKVVEASVALSRLEQAGAPRAENIAVMQSTLQALAQPY